MEDLSQILKRRMLWALALAAAASVGALLNLRNLPAVLGIDRVLHIGLIAYMAVLAVWLFSRKRGPGWGEQLLLAMALIPVMARIVFGLSQPDALQNQLSALSTYLPLIFVLVFTLLPHMLAVILSMCCYLVVTSDVGFQLYKLISEQQMAPQAMAVLQQFLFAHVIFIAALYVLPRLRIQHARTLLERDDLQRKYNRQLQEQEETARLHVALDAARMGTWRFDMASQVLSWDDQTRNLLGLRHDQFAQNHCSEDEFLALLHEDDQSKIKAYLESAKTEQVEHNTHFRVTSSIDNAVRTLGMRGQLLTDLSDQPLGLTGACWDITREQALRQQLESSNEELEQFAYVISHDLQAPLRGIVGFSQLLEQLHKDKLDDDGKEFIEMIVNGATGMQQQIIDLLELSRVGRMDTEFEQLPLDSCLDEALSRLQAVIDERNAIIERTPLPELTVVRGRMTQLLQNLISNALKFQPGDRPVVRIRATEQETAWLIQVEDEGIGISSEHSERIFQIFQRLHTADEYEGTGIGLAICRKIVQSHDGKIWVDPDYSGGTRIALSLPAIRSDA